MSIKYQLDAYLFRDSLVVNDKSMIRNATDEEYTDVTLILSSDCIKELADRVKKTEEITHE